ncbi:MULTISPECIES: helix-turn-helix domain-containing protein [Winkia]|uniref:Helix-turn-helix domain-containing protein n=1 Tax=Winkia neuii subsp. anitrata TaxID=29318 RepID=A0AB38XNQ4_9ACTO|nr:MULTISPECIES: helix-turn-helix domain-containing protein [Winkia]MDK8594630.1 helix-turn-helix domain-containing protein [Winkia sp. UMB1096A]MBS5948203.1 helix-turn-helix domain-containing protein [Winkia neuii]MDK7163023.1 helix-turn-helix domain-containing protein [Winkia sp. UMB3105]MDK7228767.1 helix-turn-helix domain-containing protein [Winkia sp. UMB1185]WCE45992.1 helix-turn-helix domain-containing protein [Winkia neuii subsp. anitrata]
MTEETATLQISFKPLWKTLIDKGMRKQDLRDKTRISASTIAKTRSE